MQKFYYEISANKKFSAGSIEASSNREATERFQKELNNGTLLRLESEKGIVLFEKDETK